MCMWSLAAMRELYKRKKVTRAGASGCAITKSAMKPVWLIVSR